MPCKVGMTRSGHAGSQTQGTTEYNQINLGSKTPRADRVLLDYINVATCGARAVVRSRSEDILPP